MVQVQIWARQWPQPQPEGLIVQTHLCGTTKKSGLQRLALAGICIEPTLKRINLQPQRGLSASNM
jgi:hypothetical protein